MSIKALLGSVLAVILSIATPVIAQQMQTDDLPPLTPLVRENARYLNGTSVGFAPTATGTNLFLSLSAGTSFFTSTIQNYAGGILTLVNGTNYVFLSTTTGIPASSTSNFTSGQFPVAIVVASGGLITSIVDVRTIFSSGGAGSGFLLLTGGTLTGPLSAAVPGSFLSSGPSYCSVASWVHGTSVSIIDGIGAPVQAGVCGGVINPSTAVSNAAIGVAGVVQNYEPASSGVGLGGYLENENYAPNATGEAANLVCINRFAGDSCQGTEIDIDNLGTPESLSSYTASSGTYVLTVTGTNLFTTGESVTFGSVTPAALSNLSLTVSAYTSSSFTVSTGSASSSGAAVGVAALNSGTVLGINISGDHWNSVPLTSVAITLFTPSCDSPCVPSQFGNFLQSNDGAAHVFAQIGTASTGNGTGSQLLAFANRDGAGVENFSLFNTDGNGNFIFTPFSANSIFTGNIQSSGGVFAAGGVYGNTFYSNSTVPVTLVPGTGAAAAFYLENAAHTLNVVSVDNSGNTTILGSYLNPNGPVIPSTATGYQGPATGYVQLALSGTTGTITGTSLSATCDSGTASVTGAVVGHPVAVSSTTGADVGGAFNLRASVTATGTVSVYICGTGTPASLAYNVTVF